MRFRKKEKVFITACLVLFILLGVFLFVDLWGRFGIRAGGRDPVGTITFLYNEVSRRFTSGAPWQEGLRQGTPVMNNDSIITGSDSSAGIALEDGTQVDMCEDSIVTFNLTGDDVGILIEKGCADIRRTGKAIAEDSRMLITAGSGSISLNKGELSIAKQKGKDPEVFVRKGKARVFDNGSQRTIEAGEHAILKPDMLSVEKRRLILADPSVNMHFFTSRETAHVEFAWEYKGDINKKAIFVVDISRSRDFSRTDKQVQSSDEMISAEMAEGNYFWRVSARNSEKGKREVSETRRFTVSRDDPLHLLSPTGGKIVEFKNNPPLIAFSWAPHSLASSYTLELSDRSDFSRLVKRIDSRVVNLSCQWERSMKQGESVPLYWRVTAGGGPPGWQGRKSETGHFTVKRGDQMRPPRLVYPDDGISMSRSRVDKEHVVFSWQKTEEGLERRILFSRDKDFGSTFRQVPAGADYWTMEKSFPSGSYFWRVGLYDGDGVRKAVSDTWLFKLRDYEDLALLAPRDRSDFTADDIDRNGLGFAWKKPDLKGTFLLELSADSDFRRIGKSVSTDSVKTKLERMPPGNYYWRVKLLTDGNAVAAASETRTFTVREGMARPSVIFPRSGGAVKMLTENELKFAWKPLRGVDAYEIELHQLVKENDKTRDKLVISTQTTGNSYTVSDLNLLDVGNFYWTLRGVKKDRNNKVVRYGKKVRNNFNINLGDSKIIIVSPEIQVIGDDKDK